MTHTPSSMQFSDEGKRGGLVVMDDTRSFEPDAGIRITVRVEGTVGGQRIDRGAEVELLDDALVIAWHQAAPWNVSLDGIDGVDYRTRECTIYLARGDALTLTGSEEVRALAIELSERTCVVPELTRGLRVFGSVRGAPGAVHDAWFAPLLAARRTVEGECNVDKQLAAMDASRLSRAMHEAMNEIAVLAAPGDPPTQRAVEAAIEEEAEDMFAMLQRLSLAAERLTQAGVETRIADWRRWVRALGDVYGAADEAWGRVQQELR
ncbi:MAG: hypothetical protein ABIW79_04315 [Gemmatimonas sp.]